MHARVSTYQGPAGLSDAEIEEITRKTEEAVLPGVRQILAVREARLALSK